MQRARRLDLPSKVIKSHFIASRAKLLQREIPMVAETWAAGASRGSGGEPRVGLKIGLFTGFVQAKREINARRSIASPGHQRAPREPQPQQQSISTPGIVFDGPSELQTGLVPPDPQIAAGPNHIVVAVNSLLTIYDTSGQPFGGFQSFSSFFASLGIAGDIFDPRIIFDQTNGRFVLSAAEIDFANLTNGHVFVAVSATDDPTQTWYKYAIDFKGRNGANTQDTFPDFPGLGISPTALYLTANQFQLTQSCVNTDTDQCFFCDALIKVIGLPELLSGNSQLQISSFTQITTTTGFPAFAIQPAVSYGSTDTEYLVAAEFSSTLQSKFNLFAISTSGNPELQASDVSAPTFQLAPDAPQAGQEVSTDDFRPLNAVWANGSLWFGQNALDTSLQHVAARWYEIATASLTTAALRQFGSVSGSGEAYYPAVSIGADGTAVLAFTTSNDLQPASAAFSARTSSDPLNSMRSYAIYRPGLSQYQDAFGNQWGDYSGLSPDPDGSGPWAFVEYARTGSIFGTAVAKVTEPPALSVTPTVLDFQGVPTGRSSTPLSFTVTNIGANSVGLGLLSLKGANAADFTIASDQCSGTSLPPNGVCAVSVSFKPSLTLGQKKRF